MSWWAKKRRIGTGNSSNPYCLKRHSRYNPHLFGHMKIQLLLDYQQKEDWRF